MKGRVRQKSDKKIMKKGFTLVELLVVIAIIAVLGTAVVLVLNPAELIKQGRDSTRVSDLGNMNSAIALYLSQVEDPKLNGGSACSSIIRCTATAAVASASSPFASSTAGTPSNCTTATLSTSTVTNGVGWVTVDLTAITGGSPLSRLPLDPLYGTNSQNAYFYGYACNGLNYELAAKLESTKYATSSVSDGGNKTDWYEVGSLLTF